MEKIILDWKEYSRVARECVAEGCVLIRNEKQVLPLKPGSKVSIFGRTQFDYNKSGTGSGGLVNAPYVSNITDSLLEKDITLNMELISVYKDWIENNPFDFGTGWAKEPWCQKEMEIDDSLVQAAREVSDIAIIVIGRLAGEEKDNYNGKGSYLLTDEEEQMLDRVTNYFDKVVVLLNVGNIIDMKWVDQYSPQAVMYIWQGGSEGGRGVSDILVGDMNPSGKLTDTIAYDISDYPSTENFGGEEFNIYEEDIYVGYRYFETFAKERVMYPFGFGLSYTSFDIELVTAQRVDYEITFKVKVTNTGELAGKEVVQIYLEPPQGKLGKPIRNLVGFTKTHTIPKGESEVIDITINMKDSASYDDIGETGYEFCYVLEEGKYNYYIGSNVRTSTLCSSEILDETIMVQRLSQSGSPVNLFKKIRPVLSAGKYIVEKEKVRVRDYGYIPYEFDSDLQDIPYKNKESRDRIPLIEVLRNNCTLEEFIKQLSDEDMIHMSRGEGMCSPKVTAGTVGAFGGVTKKLLKYGVPMVCCADGPSGIRLDSGVMSFSLPSGTLLGCSFNTALNEELFSYLGRELYLNKVDTLLGPGMNIHRNPLNGRNFEYFSEDPYLTGKMGVHQLKGMHRYNVTGTIKHFACNNQEYKRDKIDSIVSERALREIYLKGFEMAVKEGEAYSVMTTYGSVNGQYTASNYDIVTRILYNEWGYKGVVMTDWWAMMSKNRREPSRQHTSQMIKAQNSLYMIMESAEHNSGGDDSQTSLNYGVINRKLLVRNTKNILNFILKAPCLKRTVKEFDFEILEQNRFEMKEERCTVFEDIQPTKQGINIELSNIDTSKGASVKFMITRSGTYSISLRIHSYLQGISQVPMAIFNGKEVVKMLTLTSTNCSSLKDTINRMEIKVEDNKQDNFIKIFFPSGGVNFDEFVIKEVDK